MFYPKYIKRKTETGYTNIHCQMFKDWLRYLYLYFTIIMQIYNLPL